MTGARVVRTTCNRDCPDACSILAHIDNDRIVRLQGDPAHPVTQGFLCYRTDQFLARQYSPKRLTQPLIRRDGELQPASWDEALDLCATKLSQIRTESGPAAIFHYRSGGSLGLMKHVTDYFFENFGPVTIKRGDICCGAGDAAQEIDFGYEDSNDVHDLLNARAAILWGKNLHVSSPHMLPIVREFKNRGGKLVVVDPVSHRGRQLADLYVQPRPGGDVALAFGMARILFERGWMHPDAASWCDHFEAFRAQVFSRTVDAWAVAAGVAVDAVNALAESYGAVKPAAILVGWGMQRRTNGASIVRALDAIGTVSGNVGVAGGGVSFYFKRRGAFDTSFEKGARVAPRTVCEPRFGREILDARDPPIRAVWVTCGNPVVMLPESDTSIEALRTREFVVVVDSFLTDTAREATVVLPTTTLLEDDDVVGSYGHHYLGDVRPVLPPPAAVKTDFEISQEIARRVGLESVVAGSAREWKQRMLGTVPLNDLETSYVRSPASPLVAFEGRRFRTASGRANLLHDLPSALLDPPTPDGEYPLTLQAYSTDKSQSSQWSPDEPEGPVVATVHPEAVPGAIHGQRVTLRSRIGAMQAVLAFDAAQRRDVVLIPKGGSLALGRCANRLVRAVLTDEGEGAALYEEGVRVEPIPT